jgi:hypothetical protein
MGVVVSIGKNFKKLAESQDGFRGHILGLDPGERTGWAWFHDFELIGSGEIQTGTVSLTVKNLIEKLTWVLEQSGINSPFGIGSASSLETDKLHFAVEDYRVYKQKADSHINSPVYTVKVIALIEYVAHINKIPIRLRMAEHAKTFVTDERLKSWGFWQRGERHARDAIRHAALYTIDYRQWKKKMANTQSG